jgi:exopolysaccharide biosynthesis polyprenyl glycosylphosphotransferase
MLGRDREFQVRGLQVVDAVLGGLALPLSHGLRAWVVPLMPGGDRLAELGPFEQFAWLLVLVVPLTPVLLAWQGFYRHGGDRAGSVLRAQGVLLLAVMVALFLRRENPGRGALLLLPFVGGALLMARDLLTRRWQEARAAQPERQERVVFCGPPGAVADLRKRLEASAEGRYVQPIVFDLPGCGVDELVKVLHESNVNRAVISAAGLPFDLVAGALRACEIEGVEVVLLADFFQPSIARARFDDVLGLPGLVLRSAPSASWELVCKGMLDRVGALIGLVVTLPLLVVIAAGIKCTSPGPVLFRQRRGGLHGRPFVMLKFRTMTTNAEMQRVELEVFNRMTGPVFKVDNDPRVTPFGRFLRRTSLDELPQLWNVLRGDMSLVGPRPLPLYEVEKITDVAHRRRLSMKPGLTCLWQIAGRNEVTSFDDWVRLDLKYIDTWSLALDVRILLRTVPAVLLGRGAS